MRHSIVLHVRVLDLEVAEAVTVLVAAAVQLKRVGRCPNSRHFDPSHPHETSYDTWGQLPLAQAHLGDKSQKE